MEKKPLYVKVEDYKDIVDIMTLIRKKLQDARGILNSINNLKNEEDSEIEQWNMNIDEIDKKIDYLDRNLFE
jgi:peptidoglycan hydrolase CwlO-like protein